MVGDGGTSVNCSNSSNAGDGSSDSGGVCGSIHVARVTLCTATVIIATAAVATAAIKPTI